jgi:RNA polymerase sigma factor (TIGR02999 family)
VSESAFLRILQAGKLDARLSLEDLFTSLYDELHRRAKWELRQNAPLSLGPHTLLHETFLNMSNRESVSFTDHRQFMAYAARAMRGLIIDHYRTHRAQKRGGNLEFTSLPSDLAQVEDDAQSMEGLGDALESLAAIDARLAECVDLRFFCGLSFIEIAQLRDVSERTVQRDWDKARLLLSHLMSDQHETLRSSSESRAISSPCS